MPGVNTCPVDAIVPTAVDTATRREYTNWNLTVFMGISQQILEQYVSN